MVINDRWGVYVHVPWCRVRCPYCAFVVETVGRNGVPDPKGYTDAVLRQWDLLRPRFGGQPDTVAFGGGTPSLHPASELRRWIEALAPRAGAEITLEATPEDVTASWMDQVLQAGVTRLSLGVQTFQPGPARLLKRAHTATESEALLQEVEKAGFQTWSLDLLFAVPGQTLADMDRDLDTIARHGVPHLSLYGLTAEPDTPYARALAPGKLEAASEERWRETYDHLRERLGLLGLHQYEISNHAREGHRCRHNEHYWRLRSWAGLGLAAHGRLPDGTRTVSHKSLEAYLTDPTGWSEWSVGTPLERAEELLIGCLRHVKGVDLERLQKEGYVLPQALLDPLIEQGLGTLEAGYFALSRTGLPLADALVAHLAVGLVPTSKDAAGVSGA